MIWLDCLKCRPRKTLNLSVTQHARREVQEQTVLGSETFRTVVIMIRTEWQECFLDVVGIISKISPRRVVTVSYESCIDSCNIGRGIDISDIRAEVEEIGSAIARIPVKFLPAVGGVIERATDYMVSTALQRRLQDGKTHVETQSFARSL